MVADLLFLRPLVKEGAEEELGDHEKPVSLYIVPFLSLMVEKEARISGLLKQLGLKYSTIHSHKRAILAESDPPSVLLCTIQKANQLINTLVESNQVGRLRSIVIDELHLIGDESRGQILELLLTKLVYMKRDLPSLPY